MRIYQRLLPALMLLATMFCTSAHAVPIGFNGYYDYSTWTASSSLGNPVVNTTINTGQTVLTLFEGDNCGSICGVGEELFSHSVQSAGTVSFDWLFDSTIDACCSGLGFYVNSTRYTIAGGDFSDPYGNSGDHPTASGIFSVAVSAGDTIAFSAFTADNCCLASSNIFSNFNAPTSGVPEPSILALLSLGLVGFGLTRKLKKA